ncbi:MAG: metallophosphoesterase family protein [Kiritimatiellae bacterium]|nr:metallophosphoesterase family protein [Kiritimatiellia bacterium]
MTRAMRLAVVSDIHSNLPAWQAVLTDAIARGADAIICLGDVVGYGPWPVEVLASVQERCRLCVLGNHEAAMVGRISMERFRRGARRAARWTRHQLGEQALEFFRGLPLSVEVDDLLFVHSEPAAPAEFGYVDDAADAEVCFRATDARLIFIGHTHVPAVFILRDGHVEPAPAHDQPLDPHLRYLINVGSVGDPRDGSSAAAYVMFDDAAGWLEFRRCAFDVAACAAAWAGATELELPAFLRSGRPLPAAHDAAIRAPKVARLKVGGVVAPAVYLHAADLAAGARTPPTAARRTPLHWPRTTAGRVALALVATGLVTVPMAIRSSRARRLAPPTPPPSPPVTTARAERPAPESREILLPAARADRYGTKFRIEELGGRAHIGYWSDERDYLVWRFRVPQEAEYEVVLEYARGGAAPDSRVLLAIGRQSLRFTLPSTGSWSTFTERTVGRLRLPAGLTVLEARPDGRPRAGIMNLRAVRLRELRADHPPATAQPPGDGVR